QDEAYCFIYNPDINDWEHTTVQEVAARALADLRARGTIDRIAPLLKSDRSRVRATAAGVLAELDATFHAGAIMELRGDGGWCVPFDGRTASTVDREVDRILRAWKLEY
ncbi:MAG: hypothetical protein ACYTAF_07495, partial [Planctomycetota bacterium]